MTDTTAAAAAADVQDRVNDLMESLEHLADVSPEHYDAAMNFATSLHVVSGWAAEVR